MSQFEKQRSPEAVASSAVAAKTARACDGCARRRARWYCHADDAFLCQNCDFSVHSVNPLARRHRRVRLRAADVASEESSPSWLRGFKRKARTPRAHQHEKTTSGARRLRPTTVPEPIETSVDETEGEEQQQQLLYCVPVVDPALAEFCSPPTLDDSNTSSGDEIKPTMEPTDGTPESTSTVDTANRLSPFLPSVTDLAEFAADMESLLDARDGSSSMEKLGLVNSMEDNVDYCLDSVGSLKTEQPDDTEQCPVELDIDKSSETLELELDLYWPGSSTAEEEELEEEKTEVASEQQQVTKKAKLRLDYEAVISAWSRYGSSPWTDGDRPPINLDCHWPDYMGVWVEVGGGGGEAPGAGHGSDTGVGSVDVGRQARVRRYREKRRTRLFAKKIRYEVRKLNAEKRPRMKGRFVKRAQGPAAFAH